jgi:hypothetical protein
VNIPFLKVGRDRLPDRHFRMQLFHNAPCSIADTLAILSHIPQVHRIQDVLLQ